MVTLRPSRPDDADALFRVWREAVRATHDFLAPADAERIATLVKDHYLPNAALTVAVDDRGRPLAFLGRTDDMVDSLFVDPEHQGQGLGRALMDEARRQAGGPLRVDVNEQNAGARAFYERLGFRAIGRSATDSAGLPYPLVHLAETEPEV